MLTKKIMFLSLLLVLCASLVFAENVVFNIVAPDSVVVNSFFDVNVTLNIPNSIPISAADIIIKPNNTNIEISSATSGKMFDPTPVTPVSVKNGNGWNYAEVETQSNKAVSGNNKLFVTLKVKANTAGSVVVSFDKAVAQDTLNDVFGGDRTTTSTFKTITITSADTPPVPAGAITAINCTQKGNWNNISCLGQACDSNPSHNVTRSYLLPDEQSKKDGKIYGSRNGCCAKGECGSGSQSCASAGYVVSSGSLNGTICSNSDWWVCNSSLKNTFTSDNKYTCNGTVWVAYITPQDTEIQVDSMRMYVFLQAVNINFTNKSLKEYATIASALKTYFNTDDVSYKGKLLIKLEKKALLGSIQTILISSNLNSLQKVSKIAYLLTQYYP
ncbi:MAG: hypothetical protein V2A62_03030 [Candidatus Woesearchaeota archaeon]